MTASSALPAAEEAKIWARRAGRYRKAGRVLDEDALAAEWRAVESERRRAERIALEWVVEWTERQEAAVMEALEEVELTDLSAFVELSADEGRRSVSITDNVKAPLTAERLFDAEAWIEALEEEFPERVLEIIREGWRVASRRIDALEGGFDADRPQVRRAVRRVIRKAKNVPETTQERLRDAIQQGIDADESISRIVSRVEGAFEEAKTSRAETIAQTTTTASFEAGQLERFREAGIETKAWLSQRDSRVRRSHMVADGQQVAIDEAFNVGGVRLQHPGDPEGPADEVINCRCSVRPIVD